MKLRCIFSCFLLAEFKKVAEASETPSGETLQPPATAHVCSVVLWWSFSFVLPTFAVSISVSSTSFAWPISEGQRRRMGKKAGNVF